MTQPTTTSAAKLLPKQRKAYARLRDQDTRFVLYGGAAGGGKSWLGCEWLMMCCHYLPGTRWFIGRNNLKDTRESVVITWSKVAKAHGYAQYRYWDHGIRFNNGSEITFLDLTFYPQKDPLFERFGSKEFTGGWIEEGGEVNGGAFDTLKSRVGRHLNAEMGLPPKILITCNPKKNWLYKEFYRPWKAGALPANMAFIPAMPKDNPFLTADYMDNLRSIKDKARRERLLLGNWEYDDDPAALVDYDAILDAFRADHLSPDPNKRYITADIATYGADLFIIGVWYGFVLVDVQVMPKSGGKEIVDAIKAMQAKHQVRQSNVAYDNDGVGGFIGGSGGFLPGAVQFINNARPMTYKGEDEEYGTLKDQCAYHLAERINQGGYSFQVLAGTDYEAMLIEEIEQLKRRDPDSDGKKRIVRKEQEKEALGRSPDLRDMVMIREVFELDISRLPEML